MKKRTEILIEFDEFMVISHRGGQAHYSCPDCGSEVTLLTPAQASAITGMSVRSVNQRVEAGTAHFFETATGVLLVCVESLR